MEPICVAVFCLGLFAVCGCSLSATGRERLRRSRKGAGEEPEKSLKREMDGRTGTEPAAADLKKLIAAGAKMGENPLEFDYGDERRIVFHGYFGLVVCDRTEEGWRLFRTLDLKALGADAMEGDAYAVIDAGRERAYITPSYFAPDNENPVTYCFDYEENRIGERWDYQSVRNDLLSWSYVQAMAVQEEADRLLKGTGLTRSSNVFPVRGIGGGEYGFLAAENGELRSLRYCVYREEEKNVELSALFGG